MRILAISGENIASLERFEVDFRVEPLRSAGLFAITGPTGAGKSSLLDAMCLALFQRAPRLDGVAGQEAKIDGSFGELLQDNVRNLLRRGADTGWAACEFVARDGRPYRARWGYRPAKRKGASSQEELTLERLDDRQLLVGGSNRKNEFAEAIASLLGLEYEEFTRTVLLAQGRFAEFLKAPDRVRADLLETLTGTEIYAGISREVYRRATESEGAVREISLKLEGIGTLGDEERAGIEERIRELVALRARWRDDFEALERLARALERFLVVEERETALAARIAETVGSVSELESRFALASTAFAEARAARAEAEPMIQDARRLDLEIGHLEEVRKRLEEDRSACAATLETERGVLETLEARAAELASGIGKDDAWLSVRERLAPVAREWVLVREQLRRLGTAMGDFRSLEERRRLEAVELAEMAERAARLDKDVAACREGLGGLDASAISGRLRALSLERQDLSRRGQRLATALEMAGLRSEIEDVRRERQTVEERLPASLAARDAAREMVEAARLAASANVANLRARLRPDAPCPVCGSTEHPLAHGEENALDTLLSAQEKQLAEREATWAREESQRATLAERENGAVRRIDALARTLGDVEGRDPSEDAGAEALRDALGSIRERTGAITEEESRLAALGAEAERLAGLLREVGELSIRREAAADQGARTEAHCVEVRREIDREREGLDERFGSATWRERFDPDPDGYVATLERQVSEWRATTERRDRADAELRELASRREPMQASLEERVLVLDDLVARCSAATEEVAGSRTRRAALFEGEDVGQVAARFEGATTRAEAGMESIRAEVESARRSEAADRRELETLLEEKRTISTALEGPLPEAAIRLGIDRIGPNDRPALLARLGEARTAASVEGERLGEESGNLKARLQADAEARATREETLRHLEQRRALADRWKRLSDEIGSASGAKFRVIAQGFTLERLLERAQVELERLSPRYSLKRLGETMSFAIVDHESWDEVRPVHTLSGGETFLVSLALALALAGLSGSGIEVGTLFIDEGFGTLDPRTLRMVIGALSNLQAQGRQVGVITHVEELKELIPVHVVVTPSSAGSSTISVR